MPAWTQREDKGERAGGRETERERKRDRERVRGRILKDISTRQAEMNARGEGIRNRVRGVRVS